MSRKVIIALVLLVASGALALAQDGAAVAGPKLLLNAQRLRRLKRDRDRKTPRWVSFENRVNAVPDSPERGFELALYYVVTGDEAKGREAVAWALSKGDTRQRAIVLDWCTPLITEEQKKKLLFAPFIVTGQVTFQLHRDLWFNQVAAGRGNKWDEPFDVPRQLAQFIAFEQYRSGEELYALCELIYTVRANSHTDLRESDGHFFVTLPELLLLATKPSQLNAPDWHMHAAALALVEIDPNLPASQFLQSWALEDSQTLREGPGVAYELLWADPYLPGVGYQNMDPWLYDEQGRLYARAGWEPNSCWILISSKGVEQENCPPNWQAQTVTFGHMTLMPMKERCIEIPHVANNQAVMVWKLKPGEKLVHGKGKDQHTATADSAGLWRPGAAVEGKVCIASH